MFSKLHDRLGTAGLAVAVVALIAALTGTAFAAQQALNGKQKKEVEKIAKKYAGKKGAPGTPGTNGTNGKDGTNGSNGTNGTDGTSVQVGTATVGECANGGATVQVGSDAGTKKAVCNGAPGTAGSPWTAGGTLPAGSTETGVWAFGPVEPAPPSFLEATTVPITYSIPLTAELTAANVHFINAAGQEVVELTEDPITEELEVVTQTSTKCLGTVAAPTAASGHLCVYTASILQTGIGATPMVFAEVANPAKSGPLQKGSAKTGAMLAVSMLKSGAKGWGSFAVTG